MLAYELKMRRFVISEDAKDLTIRSMAALYVEALKAPDVQSGLTIWNRR